MKKQLNNTEVKELDEKLIKRYPTMKALTPGDRFAQEDGMLFINNNPCFFVYQQRYVPTLAFLLEQQLLKTISVDKGAIPFIIKGADIMRPGITRITPEIKKDEIIAVVDETYQKPLAVGIALLDAEEMQQAAKGKVVKNIHYVGDKIGGDS